MIMKKRFINIVCVLSAIVMLAGCSKKQIEDQYTNPDQTESPTIEKLFSAMMDNNRIRPHYWDLRTMAEMNTGVFSQVFYVVPGDAQYQLVDSYIGDRWRDYYTPNAQNTDPSSDNSGSGPIAQYRTMQGLYAKLPLDQRGNYDVFMNAGRALLLDQTAQMVDLFGDIPYSEAGTIDVTATLSNPAFENQKALYDTVLNGLKDIADYFSATTLNTQAQASFAVQDFMLKGNINKWRRYVNSLRLRYLMRISFVDEDRAKNEIASIIGNPIQYPLVDGDGVGDNYSPANTDILLQELTTYTDNPNQAMVDLNAWAAPDYMLNNVLLPVNDPRIPFMFDKYGATVGGKFIPNTVYHALRINTMSPADQSDSITYYSSWDSTTYRINSHIPGILMTAAETNFLKAEAFERWGLAGGTAQQSYELAVRQAIAFIYYVYNNNPTKYEALTQPSSTTVDQLLTKPGIAYAGTQDEKLGLIWTQKWLHYNILEAPQAWAEYRRTKYPQLTFPVSTKPGSELPANRLIYPTIETAYNTSYTGSVKAADTRSAKIFWDVK
jgi:hypothetical protein